MIENLQLHGVSSYSPHSPTRIGPLKRISIFYGQNGTGKTTIGNYLQAPTDAYYQRCSMIPADPDREIVVYNHTFVERNFHEDVYQPGVFTLNAENVEAENTLKEAQAALQKLSKKREEEVAKGTSSKNARDIAKQTLKDNVWKLRVGFDNTALAYCFRGLNTKEKLLEKVLEIAPASDLKNVAELMLEAAELQAADDFELPAIPPVIFQGAGLELNTIFNEVIIGSENSYLSSLIHALGHSDWVKQALSLPPIQGDLCPFCQQKLPEGFHTEIAKIFDKTYEQRLRDLSSIQRRYSVAVEQLTQRLCEASYQHPSFQQAISNLTVALQRNKQSIERKVASPSIVVDLVSTEGLIDALNMVISIQQKEVDDFNLRIKNKKLHLTQIKERFWFVFRSSCEVFIDQFLRDDEPLAHAQQQARDSIEALRVQAVTQRENIARSKAAITNVDQSVDSINKWLRILGLKGFELMKEEGDVPRYRLHRPEQKAGVFKTLSEGEKTLISFLYFLEVCNGELSATAGRLINERVIVIDDPISSLSHNYVYDIASLIKRQVLSPRTRFKQVILLTHNLFFFHELVKLLNEGGGRSKGNASKQESQVALFRITKSDYSNVVAMQSKDIQNDYQSFWQAIKDALSGRTSATVIPNMMRNILEYYFTFVHRQDLLSKALEDLSDEHPQFRALYRYVNRESHSDAVNITDFGEIDPAVYVERFKEVFIRTEFQEHYDKMMG